MGINLCRSAATSHGNAGALPGHYWERCKIYTLKRPKRATKEEISVKSQIGRPIERCMRKFPWLPKQILLERASQCGTNHWKRKLEEATGGHSFLDAIRLRSKTTLGTFLEIIWGTKRWQMFTRQTRARNKDKNEIYMQSVTVNNPFFWPQYFLYLICFPFQQ